MKDTKTTQPKIANAIVQTIIIHTGANIKIQSIYVNESLIAKNISDKHTESVYTKSTIYRSRKN